MATMFTEEELANFLGVLQVTSEFIEIDCGCTNPRYGDTPGKLRVFIDGKLEIDCTCRTDCDKARVSPVEFAKHAGKINAHANWKSQIWVFSKDGSKVGVWKTCLLKHHRFTFVRPLRQVTHRDEFMRCAQCGKDRRFSLRTKEDCKIYHDALVITDWTCSNMPNNTLSCSVGEERESRKVNRGCPRASKCGGCEQCVCFGCEMCRFETCTCQSCIDFIINM
ncbi:protein ULTRAPETALA 1-like [Salvia miltiorrhiza]|uniref:protein ULTRAPETALA 1-like n=1 Tax=Salvia miltiorrhiza TaxID=226208 RepID=UPI0025AC0DD1|nr:protein ULTRAPETALA 1-like [Salvia miltiorrhiza]